MYVVIRLNPLLAKNVPQRNRAGVKALHQPSVADVTPEQFKALQSDQYIKICNFPSVAWFEAMGIERTQKNEDSFRGEDGKVKTLTRQNHKLSSSARLAIVMDNSGQVVEKATETPSTDDKSGSEGGDTNKTPNTPPAPTGEDVDGTGNKAPETVQTKGLFGKVVELSASSPKEELIKALEKKRKKAPDDFSPDASPESLFKLLRSL